MIRDGGKIIIKLPSPLKVKGPIPHDGQVVLFMNGQPTIPQGLLVG